MASSSSYYYGTSLSSHFTHNHQSLLVKAAASGLTSGRGVVVFRLDLFAVLAFDLFLRVPLDILQEIPVGRAP
jgi:hypothetical protein